MTVQKPRSICKQPGACVAGARGPCRICCDLSKAVANMRQLNADPEFRAAATERMRKINTDPECIRKRTATRRETMAKMRGAVPVAVPKWCPQDLVAFLPGMIIGHGLI